MSSRSRPFFAKLAEKYSDDPGSAWKMAARPGRGRTVPEFEKAAFSLPKGQISDLVKSSYDIYIIRVDDKQDAHMKTLKEVKADIEPILKQQKAQRAAENAANALVKQACVLDWTKPQLLKAWCCSHRLCGKRGGNLPGIRYFVYMEAIFTVCETPPPPPVAFPQGFAVYEAGRREAAIDSDL